MGEWLPSGRDDVTASAREAGGGAAKSGADSALTAAKAAEPTSGDESG